MLALSFPHAALSQLSLSVTAPTNVTVGSTIGYSINLRSQGQGMGPLEVSSVYSSSLEFVSATQDSNVSFTRENNTIRFVVQQLAPTSSVPINVTLRATLVTTVSNTITATFAQLFQRTNVSTVVAQTPGTADVAVLITSPAPVFVNDWATFMVSLVNRGGGTVSGIFLTNRFTNGPVLIRDYRPSGGGTIAQNPTRLILNVGSLAAGQSTNYHITVQPTAATNIVLTSNFRFSGNMDTNALNNTNSATLVVQPPGATNQLETRIASTQQFNPQNALMEQRITVTNLGTTVSPNARVIISNVSFRVVNSVGTNNGHPFVLHAAPIPPGQGVELLLEYFIPSREPRPIGGLIAYSTTEVAPAARTNGTFAEFTHALWREPFGSMTESNLLLMFRSEPGGVYELQYSPSIDFTNALRALPLLVAPATSTTFIDYGPPKTISRPSREVTLMTNVAPNPVVSTNETYTTNGTTVVTNSATITNFVGFTTNYVTNLNMRFYRAMKLP